MSSNTHLRRPQIKQYTASNKDHVCYKTNGTSYNFDIFQAEQEPDDRSGKLFLIRDAYILVKTSNRTLYIPVYNGV